MFAFAGSNPLRGGYDAVDSREARALAGDCLIVYVLFCFDLIVSFSQI